jgi:imidazolonepropionase-like amidohydrolase
VPTLTPMRRVLQADDSADLPAYATEKMRRTSEPWLKSFRNAMEAGIPIIAGTDAGTPGNAHGSVAVEVKFMVEAGMPNAQALSSATNTAAKVIGMSDKVGSIAPGLFADLIFVRGNPLEDIRALDNLCGVLMGGKMIWFDAEGADGRLKSGWLD